MCTQTGTEPTVAYLRPIEPVCYVVLMYRSRRVYDPYIHKYYKTAVVAVTTGHMLPNNNREWKRKYRAQVEVMSTAAKGRKSDRAGNIKTSTL